MTSGQLSITAAITASIVTAAIIFCERAFPFVLFSKREPPPVIKFIEKYIPPMVMAALLLYCLKDVRVTETQSCLPQFAALAVTVFLHLWKNNSLISIFSGTAVFMILQKIL